MMKIILFILALFFQEQLFAQGGIGPNDIESYFKEFDLTKHDEKFFGHTLEKHIGKSQDWLEGRLVGDRHKKFVSSYNDLETANRVIKEVILENSTKIKDWLENKPNKKRLSLSKDFKSKIGILLMRGEKNLKDCNIAVVVLKRVSREAKDFFVITSYPVSSSRQMENSEKSMSWSKYPMQDKK